jgi:hypothetical protein
MPNSTAIMTPTLFRGTNGTTQGTIRPIRTGFRPFSQSTRGKRQMLAHYDRGSSNATPNYQTVGIYGVELPYETADFGSNASGQRLQGFQPNTGLAGQPTQTGTFVERIRLTGGVGTGISFITVFDGGQDISAAPTVVFTPATGAPAATAIVRDRRVVGIVVTAAGGPFTTPPVITFTGGGTMTIAPTATCAVGANTTINTHIPFTAHTGLTVGGAYWVATWRDRIIAAQLNGVAAFNNVDDGCVDPDQHVMGTAANNGFTVATGTHPDGTPTIGVLTTALGLPNNEVVTVYRGTIREISTLATHLNDKTQVRGVDLMYAVVGGAGDNSVSNICLFPSNFGIG